MIPQGLLSVVPNLGKLSEKKNKNISDEDKKILFKNNGIKNQIESKLAEKPIEPNNDYEGTVRKKIDELSKLGLINVNELYKQLPSLSGQLQRTAGKTPEEIKQIMGGATGGNLAANLTRNIDEIGRIIQEKKLKSFRAVKENKQLFEQDPSIKGMINAQFFDHLYPNFWEIAAKKAGITQ